MKKLRWIFPSIISMSLPALTVVSCKNIEKEKEQIEKKEIVLKAFEKYEKIVNEQTIKTNFEKEFLIPFNEFVKNSVENFYNENYSKLKNETLRNFYLKWKELLLKEFTLTIDWKYSSFTERMVFYIKKVFEKLKEKSANVDEIIQSIDDISDFKNFLEADFESFFLNNNPKHWSKMNQWDVCFELANKNNSSIAVIIPEKSVQRIWDKFNEHFAKFKEDAWMVVEQENLVDVSNFSLDQVPAFYINRTMGNKLDWVEYVDTKLRWLTLNEMGLNITATQSDLTQEQINVLNQKFNDKKHILLRNIKNVLGTTIDKNWDVVKVAKALAKYLIIRNDYSTKNLFEKTFLSLNEDISHFNCQGHSEFIYMSLKLLGFEKVGFEDRYFYRENKQDVNHVNNIYDLGGKRYIIDATFADKYNSSDNDLSTLEAINFFINKFIFVPINDYLNHEPLARFYVAKSLDDKTEIVFE